MYEPEYAEHAEYAEEAPEGHSQEAQGAGSLLYTLRMQPERVMQQVSWCYQNPGKPIGLPSGFPDLDALTGGFKPQEITTLAGATSMGKTALAHGITYNLVRGGHLVLIVSMEMGKDQVLKRFTTLQSDLSFKAIELGYYDTGTGRRHLEYEDYVRYGRAASEVCAWENLLVYDRACTTEEVGDLLGSLQGQGLSPELVVIDYLQLHTDRAQGIEEHTRKVSNRLKALNMAFGMPFLVLSQFRKDREIASGERLPGIEDLKGSSSIGQDTSNAWMLHRADYYQDVPEGHKDKGKAILKVEKQRDGPTGKVTLRWHAPTMRFSNWKQG